MMRQRDVNASLVPRADAAGCSALVMTLDVHVHIQRWADTRNELTSPIRATPANMLNMLSHLQWALRMLASHRRIFATMQAEHPQARNVLELAA